jgi:hypothetical protein
VIKMAKYEIENKTEYDVPDFVKEKIIEYVLQNKGENTLLYKSYSPKKDCTYHYSLVISDGVVIVDESYIKKGNLLEGKENNVIKSPSENQALVIDKLSVELEKQARHIEDLRKLLKHKEDSINADIKQIKKDVSKILNSIFSFEEKIQALEEKVNQ